MRLRPGYENNVWSYDFVEDGLDNGSEFVAGKLRDYLASAGVTTLYIEPGSPWEIRVLQELQLEDARRVLEHGVLRDMVRGGGAAEDMDTLL